MKLEALDYGPEDWISLDPQSLLAATSPLPAEPAPLLSPFLPYQPPLPQLSCLRVSSLLASSPSIGSQGNLSGFAPSPPSSFLHHPKQIASNPVPPQPPTAFLPPPSKPPYQGDSFLVHTCDVSQQASERGSHPNSQSAVFFPAAAAPASKHTRFNPGFSPPWRQQGYPGNRLLLLHSPLSRSLGSVAEAAVREKITTVVSCSPAQLSSGGFK